MKISYINFWPLKEKIDYWLYYFCVNIFNEEVELVNIHNEPDILFCSCFGSIENIKRTKAKLKIFFTGENVERKEYNEYNDEKIMKEVFDLRLGFHYNDIKNNKLRLPLWITFYNYYNMNNEKDNFITNLLNNRLKNMGNKKIFGSLVCRHDRNGIRTKILNELGKYGKVICGGKYMNSGINIGSSWKDKLDFIKNSEYTICPDNSSAVGYCTEKIMHGMEGGCIPLYWGNDLPEKNVLRRESYIFLNVEDDNLMKKQIREGLKKNIVLNVFTRESKYVLDNYYKTLEWGIKQKLNKVEKQRIYGISYASRDFIHCKQKENIFKNSGYFDVFEMYGEDNIDEKFKLENKEIWFNSKRGGGWWIWKPYLIYKKMQKMKDNDILIYFDGGCSLCDTTQAKKRFYEYIDMVNNHWTGHLRFILGSNCQEKKYTNEYTVKYFEKRYNTKMNEQLVSSQLVGGIQIIRKTKFTMDFFKEALDILQDDKYLFCEKYTKNNEFHRHDQSVMSLLYKHMNGNLILEDETWFGGVSGNGDFGKPKSLNYPIWATRYKN